MSKIFQARRATVTVLKDVKAAELLSHVDAWLASVDKSDCIWVGYGGHAVQLEDTNYLQGVDAAFSSPADIRKHGVKLTALINLIDQREVKAAVLSLDACRNDPFSSRPLTRGVKAGLAVEDPRGLCISFSTAPYTEALDGDGANSPYIQALAQALQGTSRVTLDSALRETANTVYRLTQQKQIPEHRSALRSEWWFESTGVSLRETSDSEQDLDGFEKMVRASFSVGTSYRADEPKTSAKAWAAPRCSKISAEILQAFASGDQRQDQGTEQLCIGLELQKHAFKHKGNDVSARVITALTPLARKGHPVAQNLIGDAYFSQENYQHAYKWLSLAAKAGYVSRDDDPVEMHAWGLAAAISEFVSPPPKQTAQQALKQKMMGLRLDI